MILMMCPPGPPDVDPDKPQFEPPPADDGKGEKKEDPEGATEDEDRTARQD